MMLMCCNLFYKMTTQGGKHEWNVAKREFGQSLKKKKKKCEEGRMFSHSGLFFLDVKGKDG